MSPLVQDWPPPPLCGPSTYSREKNFSTMVAKPPKTDSYGDRRLARADFSRFQADFWIFCVFTVVLVSKFSKSRHFWAVLARKKSPFKT